MAGRGYLVSDYNYWTMSPAEYTMDSGDHIAANVFIANYIVNNAQSIYVYDSSAIRPVINIKNNATFTGDGTWNNPYTIS